MESRRSFLFTIAAGSVAASVLGSSGVAAAVRRRPDRSIGSRGSESQDPANDALEAPWGLLAPLGRGSALAEGWSVASLAPVVDGAAVLTLQHASGRRERIHLCRRGRAAVGIVTTARCELLIMNSASGNQPTDEGLAQAVAQAARTIRANERTADAEAAIAKLMTHEERLARFGDEAQGQLR